MEHAHGKPPGEEKIPLPKPPLGYPEEEKFLVPEEVEELFLSSRRRHTSWPRDWSSDVCSSDLHNAPTTNPPLLAWLTLSVAEGVSQASSGGFVVGALCSAAAVTTPNCNGPATVLRVDSSGNIQSQTQYSYANGSQSTALNILKATSDGGAIFAGQPQSGCPAQNLSSCG